MKRKVAPIVYCVALWIVGLVLLVSSHYDKIAWICTVTYMVCVSFLMVLLVQKQVFFSST